MKKLLYAVLALSPMVAAAQELTGIRRLLSSIGDLVQMALPIVVGIALLLFFWGLVKVIFAAGNEQAKADGKKIMIWGIISLFVMVSVWGLVRFVGAQFGITDQGGGAPVPFVPGL